MLITRQQQCIKYHDSYFYAPFLLIMMQEFLHHG